MNKMSITNANKHRLLSAYHEAGHAVVGHLIGRYIQEISIVSEKGRYSGYCRFNAFVEDMNLHPEWHEQSKNPELITIYYAGMIAMAYFCAFNERADEYLEGSEQSDLEKINQFLLQISTNKEERSQIKDMCWEHVQKLLGDYWYAVDEVATHLLEHNWLTGGEVHSIIRNSIGETTSDWRIEAWRMEEVNKARKTLHKTRKRTTHSPENLS